SKKSLLCIYLQQLLSQCFLQIWGGVLGSILTLYAMVQWRGVVRRGGLYIAVVPLVAGAIADTLYFAAWFSTLHALAAEAGTLGLTLPLSLREERIIKAFIYSAVSLKVLKIAWINFNQCRCDIFFLDWSEYNAPFKGSYERSNKWRATSLAREWSSMQTMRRVPLGFTATLALLILHVSMKGVENGLNCFEKRIHFTARGLTNMYVTCTKTPRIRTSICGYKMLDRTSRELSLAWCRHFETIFYFSNQIMSPWQSYLPQSQGYNWALATIAWWTAYCTLLLTRWVVNRVRGPPTDDLPKICANVGFSLLVFEEDCYAHYVHGRNDDSKDLRSMAGPLATCRVVCAPQLRVVYKQLSLSIPGNKRFKIHNHTLLHFKKVNWFRVKPILVKPLLSRFLAAFFERALDGLSWVASERTVLERLLNVELTTREAGNTSTLLYDPDDNTSSCFAVTWWGEEWSLSTFDAMLFSCVLVATDDALLAALVTLIVWQVRTFLSH
ncbi:meckelin-like, partial [Trichoplusia ni]|uniref:Meckelin-like n=1 Tax=Trichoplusia ni TaxID=7111 RepID=A0A7E5WYT8_TRINI